MIINNVKLQPAKSIQDCYHDGVYDLDVWVCGCGHRVQIPKVAIKSITNDTINIYEELFYMVRWIP